MNEEEGNTRTGADNTVVNIKIMPDWKEEAIVQYNNLEREKVLRADEMGANQSLLKLRAHLSKLQLELADVQQQILSQEGEYSKDIAVCNKQMLAIKEELANSWDIDIKVFDCDAGSATIRTTRSLKIDNKEGLISILHKIGKLTTSIKSWDLTLLRKLTDADLLDKEVVHYDEKRNVIIGDEKK